MMEIPQEMYRKAEQSNSSAGPGAGFTGCGCSCGASPVLPVAVVGRGKTRTADLIRQLTGLPVEKLTPCQAVRSERSYRAVVVENFDQPKKGLSGCAAARWELSRRTPITVVGLDDPEGQRMVAAMKGSVYAYSDGRPQANLTAKNVRLRGGRLEFEALTDQELMRVQVPCGKQPRLYDCLAALAGALALGMPLADCVARLNVPQTEPAER